MPPAMAPTKIVNGWLVPLDFARAAPRRRRSAHRGGQGGAPRVARAARVRRARRGRPARRGLRPGDPGASRGLRAAGAPSRGDGASRIPARGRSAAADPRGARSRAGSRRSSRHCGASSAPRSPWGLAVRSSATCEDGALVSMAGLAESVLGVRGAGGPRGTPSDRCGRRSRAVALSRTSRRTACATWGWRSSCSAWSRRAPPGVMFTRAPGAHGRKRRPHHQRGPGPRRARGQRRGDARRPSHRRGAAASSIRSSRTRPQATVVRDGQHRAGRRRRRRTCPALDANDIAQLARIAARLEKLERGPWDVEFACDAVKTWIVQARPATGLGFPDGGGEDTVWSNVNVGEALPGVATPFTWSVAGAFSEAGFRRAFAALGCRVPKHARLVGNVHGRFYLNLTQFMRIAAQVPFLDPRTLVELGGGWGGDELAVQVQDVSRRGFYARLPITASRLLREQLRLDDDVGGVRGVRREAVASAERARSRHPPRRGRRAQAARHPGAARAHGHGDAHVRLEHARARTSRFAPSCDASRPPTRTAWCSRSRAASATSRARGPAWASCTSPPSRAASPRRARSSSARRPPGSTRSPKGPTRRALQSFIELYGDRAVREAELSTPRWKEDPRPVLRMLRAALRTDTERVEGTLARAKAAGRRGDGEARADAQRRRADAHPPPGGAGAAGGAPARAHAGVGHARARHAPRGGARRRPAAPAARSGPRVRLARARRRGLGRWRTCGACSS